MAVTAIDGYRDLQELLEATRHEIDVILGRLPELNPVELAGLLESLALRDQQRASLLHAIRNEASDARRREEERSLRQFVLLALAEVGSPQTAGFLEDYIYARERVVLKARGFAALRRDENRAWRRRPGSRVAYIVPCLDEEGQAVSRWMGRSDWPLSERVHVPGVESLWEWTRVLALANAWRSETNAWRSETEDVADSLYLPLLQRYAHELREPAESDQPDENELEPELGQQLADEAGEHIKRLEAKLAPTRAEAAASLESLALEEQLWGIGDWSPVTGRRSAESDEPLAPGEPRAH
jgi:hypothetical protein